MRLKGTLSIVRRSGGPGPDHGCVGLILVDEASRAKFLEIEIPFHEFGKAVAGMSEQPCEFEVRMKAPLGMRHEHKTELVPVLPFTQREDRPEWAASALSPFEVDGWKGTTADLFNGHRREENQAGETFQRVSFHRHVNPETGEPVARE